MFERVKLTRINDHIYLMNDNNEATGYLVIGKKRALVIDTMNGYENIKAISESLTELPLMVVNTHGHPDHIYGNIFFDEAYMNPKDNERAKRFFEEPQFMQYMNRLGLKPAVFKPIIPGDKIDLGDLVLEVYGIPGHTPGSIALLSRSDRILFSGDGIIEQLWMQLEDCLPMSKELESLEALQEIRRDYDYILCGHSQRLEDASLYEALKKGVKEVCEGKVQGDMPYDYFEGVCMAHPYDGENLNRKIAYNKASL